ncbi:MAG: AraC-like DNA-binding protein, partial [Sulfurimonas sp.]
ANANPAMLEYFEAQANVILSQIENISWYNKVEKEILNNIGDKEITIELIASNLNLGPRTLQNYLKTESKTFSTALCTVRNRLAKHYILNTNLDDITISILLGYSEVSSFYRAYKKWNGFTPKELK